MKRIIYGLLATVSGLVLLFGYRTSLEAVAPTAEESSARATASGTTSESSSAGSGATTSGLQDGTYTGASTDTRYGPVQVQINVSGGQISDVQVVDYPDGNGRDRQINQRAIPLLVSETIQTQSAQVDMVSGATYTSRGYIGSLQSALDQAQS